MRRIGLFMLVLLAATPACKGGASGSSAEREIRSALNVVAGAVDPAYDFAVDACLARQSLIADAAESKAVPSLEADRMLAVVRARCHKARATFDLIRRAHAEALALVEAGQITEAERRLDAIAEAWRSLKGGTE
jgi:hypothetical protein